MLKRTILAILIVVMVESLIIYGVSIIEEQNYIEKQELIENQGIECEHNWVVTSKYNFFLSSYKTISKCSKCGKEID